MIVDSEQDMAYDVGDAVELVTKETRCGSSLSGTVAALVNIGLLLGIAISLVTFLPIEPPFVDLLQIRLIAGLAVIVFLVLSFWLAGWPGSALGITLLGMALAFTALVGQFLGLVGGVLSFLTSFLAVLLMLSDWPILKDGEWVSDGYLVVYIGFWANLVVAALIVILWLRFGTVTYGL